MSTTTDSPESRISHLLSEFCPKYMKRNWPWQPLQNLNVTALHRAIPAACLLVEVASKFLKSFCIDSIKLWRLSHFCPIASIAPLHSCENLPAPQTRLVSIIHIDIYCKASLSALSMGVLESVTTVHNVTFVHVSMCFLFLFLFTAGIVVKKTTHFFYSHGSVTVGVDSSPWLAVSKLEAST